MLVLEVWYIGTNVWVVHAVSIFCIEDRHRITEYRNSEKKCLYNSVKPCVYFVCISFCPMY
jgi:hypothetical protein